MAGYKREKKIYNLRFSDPDMAGLEVKTRSTSLGGMLNIVDLAMRVNVESAEDLDVSVLDKLFGRFAKVLISWNLEDDARECAACSMRWFDFGEDACPKCGHEEWAVIESVPVPATKAGLLAQDMEFAMTIVNAWQAAVSNVGADLGKGSTNGANFPEVSIPMELLSKSPGS